MKYDGQERNWWPHQKQQLPHTTLCPLTSTRWIKTKINYRTQHFFCVFHKKWTTALKLKSQKFDEQSWCPPKLIELCMVAILWRHGLIKFDNYARLAMFWTFRSHVRLNIVTVNLLESFSLHWSFYIWDCMAKNGPSKNWTRTLEFALRLICHIITCIIKKG